MTPTEQLLKIYERAYIKILENISKQFTNTDKLELLYSQDLARSIKKEMLKLNVDAEKFCESEIKKVYDKTQRVELMQLGKIESLDSANFAQLNKQAIELLRDDLQKSLIDVNTAVSENLKETIKKINIEASLEKITTDTKKSQVFQNAIDKMVESGITSFIDAAGREWQLNNYVSMAVQTKLTETVNTAIINTAQEVDSDLVRMSNHATSCPACAIYENRIYSISGNDKRFPKLSGVFGDYNTIHPRCRHRLTVYIEEGEQANIEKDIERSNKPFVDNRSESKKELYETRLEAKRIENRINKISEKIKIAEVANDNKDYTEIIKGYKAEYIINRDKLKEYKKNIVEWKID